MAIAVLFTGVLLVNLRICGIFARSTAGAALFRRFAPWQLGALLILIATGLLMIVAEPERVLDNSVFWQKMVFVLVGTVITALQARPLMRAIRPGAPIAPSLPMKIAAVAAIAACVMAIIDGRWIAYAL
jgi:hypothetical protein